MLIDSLTHPNPEALLTFLRAHLHARVTLHLAGEVEVLYAGRATSMAEAGDRLLLCSDGLSSVVTDQELLLMLSRPMEPEATARILVNAANDGGGPDNITALIIDVHRDSPAPRYPLPVRREDGPTYVDVLLSTQRGSSLLTYLLLMVAYFTLLGIMLVPERRMLIGLLGTATLLGLLVWQRTQVTRRTLNVLKSPSAALDPAPPAPDSPLSSSRH